MKIEKGNNIEKQFENAILSFHYKLVGKFQDEAKKKGFTTSQLEVLRYVGEQGNPTMKEIAKHLNIKPPSVTAIIDVLCEKQFLKREFDENDRRIARIIFAPKFLKLFSSFKKTRINLLKESFSPLSIKDKKELIKIINKLIKE